MSVLTTMVIAFFGGVVATAIGALGTVILCAFVALIGVFAMMAGCGFNIVMSFAFGLFFAPHAGLGPATVANNYAKKKGLVEDSKNIAFPLTVLGRADVLIVGGVFAVIAWYINVFLSEHLAGKLDTVSTAIVVIGMISKLLWGNEGLTGKVPEGDRRFGVNSPNKWMPHMPYGNGLFYWLFGGGVGLLSAWLYWEISEYAKQVGSPLIASIAIFPMFALAVISLTLMCSGLPCPVFHHTGMVGAYAAMTAYNAGCSQERVLLWGFACGIFAHFAGDILADLFEVYGDGYVDPPSMAMAFCSVFTWDLFPVMGLYNADSAISVIAPAVIVCLFGVFAIIVQRKRDAEIRAAEAI